MALTAIDTNNAILAFIALFNLITAVLAYRTHQSAVATRNDMAIVEKATNSMKDALVKATGEAAHSAGVTEGLAQAAGAGQAFMDAQSKSQENKP